MWRANTVTSVRAGLPIDVQHRSMMLPALRPMGHLIVSDWLGIVPSTMAS